MEKKEDILVRLYGSVLIKFENVTFKLRSIILEILYPKYSLEQLTFCEIMTEGLTADPLRKKLLALIISKYSDESLIYKYYFAISKHFSNTIEIRNSFAHGTIYIGYDENIYGGEIDSLSISHSKIKATGIDSNPKSFSTKKLNLLIAYLIEIEKSLKILFIFILHPDLNIKNTATFVSKIEESIEKLNKFKIELK
ncbi:hypothetical protein [Parasediminibacterium sp. JCM 36343]|uniref:hypothetical protein n=1 Tax=Parasediminibacterium sp. JCM 36343 TaxID=3374279 RepID=UPI00397DEFBF